MTTVTSSAGSSGPLPVSPVRLSPVAVDFLCGTISGMFAIAACFPLDTLRVRRQTAAVGHFSSIPDLIQQTFTKEGPLAFYKGLSLPLFTQGIQKAGLFTVFGKSQRFFKENQNSLSQLQMVVLSGGLSGFFNCFLLCPIELIRSKLQVNYTKIPLSPIEMGKSIIQSGGLKGLYKGLLPMIYRDVPGVAAWYFAFEWGKMKFLERQNSPLSQWQLMGAGALGGLAFWTAAFPQDTIKSVIQTRADSSNLGFFATGRSLVADYGWRRLWLGFPLAAARGIPGAAMTFWSYTQCKKYFEG